MHQCRMKLSGALLKPIPNPYSEVKTILRDKEWNNFSYSHPLTGWVSPNNIYSSTFIALIQEFQGIGELNIFSFQGRWAVSPLKGTWICGDIPPLSDASLSTWIVPFWSRGAPRLEKVKPSGIFARAISILKAPFVPYHEIIEQQPDSIHYHRNPFTWSNCIRTYIHEYYSS